METTDVKGNWHEQKRKLKQQFPVLTDGDLLYWEGRQEEMLAKLEVKLGKSRQELQAIIGVL